MKGIAGRYLDNAHSVIEMLLNDGDGLTLGPDSDGLLNFCDMPTSAQPSAQAGPSSPAAAANGKDSAASSEEVIRPAFPAALCMLERPVERQASSSCLVM